MLPFYVQHFNTVELNNTFYRLPSEKTLTQWRESTPSEFCFAMKGSRYLTHMKKLKDPEPGLENFFVRADLLRKKLGPIVFQLPPHWPVDLERLNSFLKALPSHHRYSFEFRNPTWHNNEVYKLLQKHNAAFCIYDLAGFQSPLEVTADLVYIRLHGPGGKYQGTYDGRVLRSWADRIAHWKAKSVYIYFDNDEAGYAAKDAIRLKEILKKRRFKL